MNQEKSIPASGTTGADGSYSLSNVLAGVNKVFISPPSKIDTAAANPSNPEAYKAFMTGKGVVKPADEKPPFPKKYQTAETSGLSFTVKEGANTFDVEMKDGA
jgi:hypothetical protein